MILIALGANIGSPAGAPAETLRAALRELPRQGIAVSAVSSFYASPAWPNSRDPAFVNAVAQIEMAAEPARLLMVLKQMERHFGRVTAERNAPRPLDLDIIDYNGRVERGPPILPHPRLHERGFVLIPLLEIAPEWHHPVSGASADTLIARLPPEARLITRLSGGAALEPE
ncbi:MAG TPA: 2-amino-4-hydroxy-6-hydroxymethyldihydropteridine diphosphokinase [Rhizomicrobium sp.]